MKLGAALSQRAKLAQKLNDLKGRIKANCLVQEGQGPTEDPQMLIEEYESASAEFRIVVQKIAEANASTMVEDRSLLGLLQDREELIRLRNLYGMACDSASTGSDRFRYMRSELPQVPAVDVASLRRKEEGIAQEISALDARIQQTNWETDVPD